MKRKLSFSPVIAVILAVLLVGTGVAAAFLWNQSIPTTVQVLGGDAAVYSDAECTTPLEALTFSAIRVGETAGTTFYLKNTGDDPIYAVLFLDALTPDMVLASYGGEVGADPARLNIGYGTPYTPEGRTTTLASAILSTDPIDTIPYANHDAATWGSPGIIKIDDELFSYTSIGGGAFQGVVRGIDGTTPAVHDGVNIIISLMMPTDYAIPAGEVVPVHMNVTAGDVPRGEQSFSLVIEARATPY